MECYIKNTAVDFFLNKKINKLKYETPPLPSMVASCCETFTASSAPQWYTSLVSVYKLFTNVSAKDNYEWGDIIKQDNCNSSKMKRQKKKFEKSRKRRKAKECKESNNAILWAMHDMRTKYRDERRIQNRLKTIKESNQKLNQKISQKMKQQKQEKGYPRNRSIMIDEDDDNYTGNNTKKRIIEDDDDFLEEIAAKIRYDEHFMWYPSGINTKPALISDIHKQYKKYN